MTRAQRPAHPASLTLEGEQILFPRLPFDIHERTEKAVHDEQLVSFVERATIAKNEARKATLAASFGDRTDAIRSLAGRIKQHTLDHLDHYIELFEKRATEAGAHGDVQLSVRPGSLLAAAVRSA